MPRGFLAAMGLAATLAVLTCLGCAEQPAGPAAPAAEKTTLPLIDRQGLAQALAQRKGKIVLVDFWATWCPSCLELFPHTVQLHRQYAAQGLEVMAVSLDEPEASEEAARFLAKQQADFACFLSREGGTPQAATDLEIPDGGLPHLRLYDREGRLYRAFNLGQFQPSDIDQAVQELLQRS